jgi:carbonic anhydrase
VQRTVERLKLAKPIVSKGVAAGTVKVVGGVYDLATGRVDFGATA